MGCLSRLVELGKAYLPDEQLLLLPLHLQLCARLCKVDPVRPAVVARCLAWLELGPAPVLVADLILKTPGDFALDSVELSEAGNYSKLAGDY